MVVTQIGGKQIGPLDLTAEVTGTLPVGNGGTGVANPTVGNLLVGAGSSAMTALAPGPAGQVAKSNGSAWVAGPQLSSDEKLELYHDFSTKTAGAVASAVDTGQTWKQVWTKGAAATPAIATANFASARFVDPDNSASSSGNYLQTQLTGTVTYMEVEWDYATTGVTSLLTGICIAAPTGTLPTSGGTSGLLTSPAPDISCHLGLFLDHYEYGKFTSNVFTLIAAVPYVSTFPVSTVQHAEVMIDKINSVAYVRGPDGNIQGHHDAQIGTDTPTFVFCENTINDPTTQRKSGIKNFSADSTSGAPLRNYSQSGINKAMALLLAGQTQDINRLKASSFILVDPAVQAKTALHDVSLLINGAGSQTYKYPAMGGVILNDSRVFSRTTELNLNTSVVETDIINKAAVWGQLVVGSTFRISLLGTIQTQATSGILTFRVYLGATAAAQTFVMPTQGVSAAVGFHLNIMLTIRSLGAAGTMIASGWGEINFATPARLTTTSVSTTTVDTTGSGSTVPLVKATAQWATSSATNILKVETATIEQVV